MLYFILGVLAMSLLSFISCAIFDTKNDDLMLFLMGGPVMWVYMLTYGFIARPILHWFLYHNRRSLVHNVATGKYYYCDPKDYDFLYNAHPWEWGHLEDFDKSASLWGKRFTTAGKINLRYASKAVWKNLKPVPKVVIEYEKELQKNLEE